MKISTNANPRRVEARALASTSVKRDLNFTNEEQKTADKKRATQRPAVYFSGITGRDVEAFSELSEMLPFGN